MSRELSAIIRAALILTVPEDPTEKYEKIREGLTPLLVDGAADGTAAVPSLLEQMPILQAGVQDMPSVCSDGRMPCPYSSLRLLSRPADRIFIAPSWLVARYIHRKS